MYREIPPPEHLRDVASCLWVRTSMGSTTTGAESRTHAPTSAPSLIVPDGCTDIMSVDGQVLVAGPDDRPVPMRNDGFATIVGIRFRPGRAGVLGAPLGGLRNERVALAELWGDDAGPLEDELAGATVGGQLATLVHAVAGRIETSPEVDPLVADVVRRLASGDRPAVPALAAGLGVSERQLRRRTTDALGYGPTTFARIIRFQRALDRVRAGDRLADVAATAGYADQAHLTREVRALAGATPGTLAREAA